MRRFALRLCLGLLLCAVGSSLRAENVSHGFNTMTVNGQITFSNKNTVGTTNLVTYTCTDCKFGGNDASQVCLIMANKNCYCVLSPALNNVKSLYLETSVADPKEDLEVYVSENGSTWSEALTGATIPMSGAMKISIPEGYYYLKIANTSATKINISIINYEFDNCPSCYSYDY